MSSYNLSWFQNAFSDLQTDVLVQEKLKEIKVALTGLHSSQIGSLATSLSLKILFDCLNSLEKIQVQMTCDILKILLSSVPPVSMFQQYEVELARALKHPDTCVKETVLLELSRLEGERDIEILITKRPALINDILELIKDNDLSIAQLAIDLLTKIGETNFGFKSLLLGDVDSFLHELEDSGAVHSLRVYQVMLEIGSKSEEKLNQLEHAGLWKGFGNLLTSDDVLGKMAAVEELSKLVATPHGYRFLSRQNCIHLLSKELSEAQNNSLCSLIAPGLLKFFGCACQKQPAEVHKDCPQVVDTIISLVHSDDLIIATNAIEAVGFISSSSKGKLLLNQAGDEIMKKVCMRIEEMIRIGQSDCKHRILYALANLIYVKEEDLKQNNIVYMTDKWFSYLSSTKEATSLIFNLSKNPFPEIKLAAFQVISKLASLEWGQKAIKNHPGGLDYLLDRYTETAMPAVLAKYEIIIALANSSTSVNVFNEIDYANITEYKNQGATYCPDKLFVAVEGAE